MERRAEEADEPAESEVAKALHGVHKADLYTELGTGGAIGWKEHCKSFGCLADGACPVQSYMGIPMLRVHSD